MHSMRVNRETLPGERIRQPLTRRIFPHLPERFHLVQFSQTFRTHLYQEVSMKLYDCQILGRLRALTSNVTKYNQKPLNNITLQQSQNLDVIASPNNCS